MHAALLCDVEQYFVFVSTQEQREMIQVKCFCYTKKSVWIQNKKYVSGAIS